VLRAVASLEFDLADVAFTIVEFLLACAAGEADVLRNQVAAVMYYTLTELVTQAVNADRAIFTHDLSP
jgi:phosphoribosyl-ATP pyrophosphohydrolase